MDTYSSNIRRKDRQQPDREFLVRMLNETLACTISVETSGYPLLHVAFFAYDAENDAITFHFSGHGQAGKEIITGKKVTISLYKYGKLYTGKKATDFGGEYQSIIAYGKIQAVEAEDERMRIMDLLFQKFFSNISSDTYQPFTIHDTKPINVVSVKIEDWLGKEHRVPEEALSSFSHSISPQMN